MAEDLEDMDWGGDSKLQTLPVKSIEQSNWEKVERHQNNAGYKDGYQNSYDIAYKKGADNAFTLANYYYFHIYKYRAILETSINANINCSNLLTSNQISTEDRTEAENLIKSIDCLCSKKSQQNNMDDDDLFRNIQADADALSPILFSQSPQLSSNHGTQKKAFEFLKPSYPYHESIRQLLLKCQHFINSKFPQIDT